MSRFRKLAHTIWHCQYHIVWTPKYRFRVLAGPVKESVSDLIHIICDQNRLEVIELNIQVDHVHLILMVPPKHAISKVMGWIKGKSAIRVFKEFPELKRKPYWGNHFWSRGYCVDTVGLDEEKIRKYVRHQEQKDRLEDGSSLGL